MRRSWFRRHPALAIFTGILDLVLLIVVLFAVWLWFWPLGTEALSSKPEPTEDYASAVAAVAELATLEEGIVNPVCHTRLLDHGQPTAQAILMIHGFGSCPAQFSQLAEQLHSAGYTVLLARMPRHGDADRLTQEVSALTAEEVVQFADRMVDIASGLGDKLTVLGFSGGGTVATWTAYNRPDIDEVVLIAPLFNVQAIPNELLRPAVTLLLTLPDSYGWYDDEKKENIDGPPHAYPGYSMHALMQFLRLGQRVQSDAAAGKPLVPKILVIDNAGDEVISRVQLLELVKRWQAELGDAFHYYLFPEELDLKHDMVDPAQPDQRVDTIYPAILEQILQHQP